MKQFFFHSFTGTLFEIVGQLKSGPADSVGWREGGVEVYPLDPLTYKTVTSHRQKLTCRVLKVLIVLFSQATKYT